MARRIYLDFFGDGECNYDVTLLVEGDIVETNPDAREEFFTELAKHIQLGEETTLIVESAAPIGELADIYKMVASLSGHVPTIEVLPSGLIPPVQVKMTF
jgi:hypothetical protein